MAGGPVLSHGPPAAGDSRTTAKAREGITLVCVYVYETFNSHITIISLNDYNFIRVISLYMYWQHVD